MAATKKRPAPVVGRRMAEWQRTIEKQVRRGVERGMELLPAPTQKSIRRLTTRIERTQRDLEKRGEKLVKEARKRAERFGADLRKRIEETVTPVSEGIDTTMRREVTRLRKRVRELEHELRSHAKA